MLQMDGLSVAAITSDVEESVNVRHEHDKVLWYLLNQWDLFIY